MNLVTILWALVALAVVAAVAVRAIGGNLRLVSHWKLAFKYYSTYGALLLAFLPDFWNALVAAGTFDGLDGEFGLWQNITIKALVAWNLLVSQIKQVDAPKKPDFD